MAPTPTAPVVEGVRVRALARSAVEGSPSVRIVSPRADAVVRGERVQVTLEVRDWALRPPPGRHVHLSLDGGREMAISDVSAPIDLAALLTSATGEALTEGSHVLRAQLGRADHESVKRTEALATVVFHYRARTRGFAYDAAAPGILLGRPQGCASNTTRLLDFTPLNVPLAADAHRVRYTIDEFVGETDSWAPHRISGLRRGQHTVTVVLLDPSGEPVPGAEASHGFRVDPDCPTYAVRPYQPSEAEDDDDDEGL